VITILKILACWGCGSIALGLLIGPMLRSATADLADCIGGLDGPNAPDANGVPHRRYCSAKCIACAMATAPDKVLGGRAKRR
jgi:hypothetical protein